MSTETLYAGVIASPDRGVLERVNSLFFQLNLQHFDRWTWSSGEPIPPRIYGVYYPSKVCAPALENGKAIIRELQDVPWRWQYIDLEAAQSADDVRTRTNALWDALDLKRYGPAPSLDVGTVIKTSLCADW